MTRRGGGGKGQGGGPDKVPTEDRGGTLEGQGVLLFSHVRQERGGRWGTGADPRPVSRRTDLNPIEGKKFAHKQK